MTEIKCFTIPELREALVGMGEKPYQAEVLFRWLHRGAESFREITTFSKAGRAALEEAFRLTVPKIERRQVSRVDGTVKYLWRLHDGECVESVLMQYRHGNTACVSSQVGCRMGCCFCASGQGGLVRNLSAGEILDQVLFMQKDSGKKVSNIVLMGTGEPLDNYDSVLKFIRLVSCPEGICIGQRHLSLSTSGLADKIERLAEEKLQLTLSVSLHAPDDETRSRLMPVNRRYPLERLIRACEVYFDRTGRRVSYEYAMSDASDHPHQAKQLVQLLKRRPGCNPGHVNLIPLNPVKESSLRPSSRERVRRFQQILEQGGITATVRRRLGPDIDAACGQLRRRRIEEGESH